jgi:cytidylate kinase
MAIITISRDYASGGRKVGRILAKRLNYQYVDKSLFQRIAEDLNVSERTLESFEGSREYRISNIFSKLFGQNYIQRIVGHDRSVIEDKEYQNILRNLIIETAKEDNVVIIGRAANFFLKDMENCFHFNLIASMNSRKKYAIANLKVSRDRTQEIIEKHDNIQLWFKRSICGEDCDNQFLFHLTLNMSFVTIEKAVEIIESAVNVMSS